MYNKSDVVFAIGGLGFFTAWLGMFIGIVLSLIIVKRSSRIEGTTLGFIGGLILALVCFDLLPESFEMSNVYVGSIGIILGLMLASLLEGRLQGHHNLHSSYANSHFFQAAFLLSIGIGIHNIPGGITLGSLLYMSYKQGIVLAIILILHGISEGISVGIFLKRSKATFLVLILFSILTSIPMGIGSILGIFISDISPYIISISLSFAAGLILYITFREILSESRETWKGRLSTIGNILGIVTGILISSFLH